MNYNFTKNENIAAILTAAILTLDSCALKFIDKQEGENFALAEAKVEECLEGGAYDETQDWQELANRCIVHDMDGKTDIINARLAELTNLQRHSLDASLPPLPITMTMNMKPYSQDERIPEYNPQPRDQQPRGKTKTRTRIGRERERRQKNN